MKRKIQGMWGKVLGKNKARRRPFWIFQSMGLMLTASNFSKTSFVLGVGTPTWTCWKWKWRN